MFRTMSAEGNIQSLDIQADRFESLGTSVNFFRGTELVGTFQSDVLTGVIKHFEVE
ncbi:hypothetical protein PQC43_gp082 [Escherichia phage vB_EcoP-101114UKE3]|nr:hypothetical protein PQC43_gp082 [Escherichia phage vB_EcoP-101114UKE3]QZI79213.1 hypothetical protein 101114UKE3_082 [Escherichia phage vB_EcoP-101114UKE3]USM81186.1 hypothetical protein 101114BS3_059 [Escherichia phage vB_EcoP-101114BS3]